MRGALVHFAWVALTVSTACGGSSGSTTGATASGTIGGQPFVPAEASAVLAGPANCSVPTAFAVKAFAVRLASFSGVCTGLQSNPLCKLTPSATEVTVVFADVGVASVAPALGPGTFTLSTDPAAPTLQTSGPLAGTLVSAFALATVTGTTCPVGTSTQVAQGTLQVKSVSPTAITGTLDLTFGRLSGGTFTPGTDTLRGDFSATVCGQPIDDVCALASAGGQCTAPTCS